MIQIVGPDFIETVKTDIDEVSVKSNEPSLYTDILNGVKAKRMFAFSGCGGFFVLMPISFYGAAYVSVVMARSRQGECFGEMAKFARARAKEIGAKGFMFSTANKKLERVARKKGWIYRGKRGCMTDWLVKM